MSVALQREIRQVLSILSRQDDTTVTREPVSLGPTVDSDVVDMSREAEPHLKSLLLSLLWGLYASVMLIIGIVRRLQPVRLGGLALLAIPIAKLFVWDTFKLEQVYSIVAYLSLSFILLAGGLLYQRYSEAIKGFLFEEQAGGSV